MSSNHWCQLGVLGGGQLARMMVPPAQRLGIRVAVLERKPQSPAGLGGALETVGDWNDGATALAFARSCDVITLDHEFVDADILAAIERAGIPVRPGSEALRAIQDKFLQKSTLVRGGLAVPHYEPITSVDELLQFGERFSYPFLLKARRDGYDGHGNRLVQAVDDAGAAWAEFGQRRGGIYAEQFVPFVSELAVMVVRGLDGTTASYPVAQTIQRNNICHEVVVPAPVPEATAVAARAIAERSAELLGIVGDLGVELFLLRDGTILVNELAPRPHNSGHYTIEACVTSQFENHVRAVTGLPLGDTTLREPAAAMVNLLADEDGPGIPAGLAEALQVRGAALHLYQKAPAVRGRKMGHITVTADTAAEAVQRASSAAAALRFSGKGAAS